MATEYVLNRDVLRRTKRDDRGRVTYRKRFVRGDVVTDLEQVDIDRLTRNDAIVPKGDYVEPEQASGGPSVGPAALSGQTAAEDQGDPDEAVGEGNEYTEPEADETDEDEYDGMTAAELSEEAESRGLAKSGSKADLQARLREDDANQ